MLNLVAEAQGRMSTEMGADRYNMENPNRGKCVVFNHETFATHLEPRKGSSVDTRKIKQTFQQLGFTVDICNNYEYYDIIEKLDELRREDHSDNDCLCIFVLTHGMADDFICAKDTNYKLDKIWKPFTADKCSTLAGKPKLFFFQACRGDNLDHGVRMIRSRRTQTDGSGSDTSYRVPTHADFLFGYSTVPGFYSWRNPEEGTWYVQSLCDVLDEYAATRDLVNMLTITNRNVVENFEIYNNHIPWLRNKKQMSSFTSNLMRDIYFTPKNQRNTTGG
ncbi:caspase-1-like [Nasonia vitripennis]|uniref:Caspase-1 n=1 Tax=Nasonia vitripennis TaxID=7425 RepID=A0A7M7QAW2_NASVI|nr:caspase-1-like [Nasonia vitripennis]